MGIYFFKLNKPKQYNYKPVFFDPQKEKIEQIKNSKTKNNETNYSQNIKNNFSILRERRAQKKPIKSQNLMLVVMAFVLIGLTIYFLLSL